MARGPILYEVDNMTLASGTGIATYAGNLVRSAIELGHEVDGVFSVRRSLAPGLGPLNEILAFDSPPPDGETMWQAAKRHAGHPFRCLFGLRPTELTLSGLVVGSTAEKFKMFDRLFAVTDLKDAVSAHFWLYGKLAPLKPPVQPWLFHATQPLPLCVKGSANVYTIHDLVPLRLPHTTLDDKKYFYRMLLALAKNADHIVTVSEHSRRDIVEFLGVDEKRVTNTYQPVEFPPHLLARSDDDIALDLERSFGLTPGDYFLYYGAIEPKKNVARLVDAYVASGVDHPLIVVGGKGWQNQTDLRKLGNERFSSYRFDGTRLTRHRQVRRFDYLPLERLVSLIRGARAVLFPSIYEGFGLPVVEAMLLGTPVITSNSTALAEVAGDAALLADPYSVDDLASAIRTIDSDQDLRQSLAERGRCRARTFSRAAHNARLQDLYGRL
ncbi:glycosyltransferase [Reyranella sp.]|uniref:glycosyltransferase n=1 Tax=Reyranella sp. TaxID=1929291 RepID=UPI003BAC4DDF